MRKKLFKKPISLLLSLVMVFSVFAVAPITTASAAVAKTQAEAISWLTSQSEAYYDLDGAYGAQCSDFASAYMNWLTDGNPYSGTYGVYNAYYYPTVAGWNTDRWTVIANYAAFVPEPGDIFISVGDQPEYGHIGVVISSDVNNATVIDQNARSSSQNAYYHYITWTGHYAATYYIRPNFSTAEHVHNYTTYVYSWAAHPHYKCYACSCGDVKEDRSQPTYSDSCGECNRPNQPVLNMEKTVYEINEPITFTWNETQNTTHYNWVVYPADSWEHYDREFYATSGITRTLPAGEYKAVVQSYNSNYWEDGNTDWVHTISEPVYFSVAEIPDQPVLNMSKTVYDEGEEIEFTWEDTAKTTHYNWVVYPADSWGHYDREFFATSGITRTLPAGEYKAVVQSYNSNYWEGGHTDWVHTISEPVYFSVVKRPDKPTLNMSKTIYAEGEEIEFTWEDTSNTTHYNWVVYPADSWGHYDREFFATSGIKRTLPAGEYKAVVQSYNSNYWEEEHSDWVHTISDPVYFTVYETGDSNLDGNIDVRDATEIQKYLVGVIEMTDEQLTLSDLNGDGYVSIIDATIIQKKTVGFTN